MYIVWRTCYFGQHLCLYGDVVPLIYGFVSLWNLVDHVVNDHTIMWIYYFVLLLLVNGNVVFVEIVIIWNLVVHVVNDQLCGFIILWKSVDLCLSMERLNFDL